MRSSVLLRMIVGSVLALSVTLPVEPVDVDAESGATVLTPAYMEKLMPATVFYRGETATTQLRNSGGIKFSDGYFVLTSMVDTSGYSTGVAAKYQAYFITETPIEINGRSLATGVYGIGFVNDTKFVVTDVGAHDVLQVDSATDTALERPRPLQIIADPKGGFRLYSGRRFVILTR